MGTKCLLLRYLEPITAELDRGLALLEGDLPFHELCPPAPPSPCLKILLLKVYRLVIMIFKVSLNAEYIASCFELEI